MKLSATFEDGVISLILDTATESEERMLGAVIRQPAAQDGSSYLDKDLISCSLRYEGHWTNKRITQIKLCVYKPNEPKD